MRQQRRDIYVTFRPDGSPIDVQISNIKRAHIKDFVHMEIGWIRVQTTYYGFPQSTIKLSEDGGVAVDVILSAGNYTATTWIAELQTKLSAAGVGAYTATYSAVSGKLTIVASGVTNFSIGFDTDSRKLERYFGVPVGTSGTPSYQLVSSGTTLISTNPIILSGPQMLYLVSESLSNILVRKNHVADPDIDSAVRTDIDNLVFGFTQIAEPYNEYTLPINDEYIMASAQQSMPPIIDVEIRDEDNKSIDFLGGSVTFQMRVY